MLTAETFDLQWKNFNYGNQRIAYKHGENESHDFWERFGYFQAIPLNSREKV